MIKLKITTLKIRSIIAPIGLSVFACAFACPVSAAPRTAHTAARSDVANMAASDGSFSVAGQRYAYEDPETSEREQELRAQQQENRQELQQIKREKKRNSKMKKHAKKERQEEKAEEREERAEHAY
jgi:hypothetical protein